MTTEAAQKYCLLTITTIIAAACISYCREIFIPIAMAIVLNLLFRPIVRKLEAKRIPPPVSATLIVLSLILIVFAAVVVLDDPVGEWFSRLPQNISAAQKRLKKLTLPVQKFITGLPTSEEAPPKQGAETPAISPPNPSTIVGKTTHFAGQLIETLLLFFLLLATGNKFFKRVVEAFGPTYRRVIGRVAAQSEKILFRYFFLSLLINIGQAALVSLALWFVDFPSPLLWGVATLLLEFIPYLGGTIIVILLAATGLTVFQDIPRIIYGPGVYLTITTLQNNLVSPIAYGNTLKLNPVAILIGVIVWWFLLGIAGAFIAVPLLAIIRAIAEQFEGGKWLAALLGDEE